MKFSMRVKGWFRKAVKPAAMALIAGTVALGLVVGGSNEAHASVILPPPVLLGSGTMPLAEAVGVVSLAGPIGWTILGLGVVAVGLVATQDYWVPWVTKTVDDAGNAIANAWGKPTQNTTASGTAWTDPKWGTATYTQTTNLVVQSNLRTASVGGVTVPYIDVNYVGSSAFNEAVEFDINCRRASDGAKYQEVRPSILTNYSPTKRMNSLYPQTNCDANGSGVDKMIGYVVQPLRTAVYPGLDPQYYFTPVMTSPRPSWGDIALENPDGFDPKSADTKYAVSVECVRADGTKFTLQKTSTGADGALAMPACGAADSGSHATGAMTVVGTPPVASKQPAKTLLTRPAVAPLAGQPLCDISKPGQPCKLAVYVDGKECVVGQWECANWSKLTRDTNWQPRISCQQGPYPIAIGGCNVLERAYETGGAPATEANTDGNPDTRSDIDPNGQQIPRTSPQTGTGTGTGAIPETGVNPSGQAGEQGENCWGSGWSWNPVSWVMVPVSCSLEWAFVPPRAKLQETADAIEPKLEVRGIGPMITPIITGVGSLGGSGCAGPPIDLSVIHLPTFYPFSACDAPMSTIAGGVNVFFSLWLCLTGGLSCVRAIGAAFGFNMSMGAQLGDFSTTHDD